MPKMRAVELDASPLPPKTETVDTLLDIWYGYTLADRPHLGGGKCSPMFRHATPSSGNVHDDDDIVATRLRTLLAKDIDAIIDALPTWQMRVAVDLHAANRRRPAVWRNPRLTPEQALMFWQEARVILAQQFADMGLIEGVAED